MVKGISKENKYMFFCQISGCAINRKLKIFCILEIFRFYTALNFYYYYGISLRNIVRECVYQADVVVLLIKILQSLSWGL